MTTPTKTSDLAETMKQIIKFEYELKGHPDTAKHIYAHMLRCLNDGTEPSGGYFDSFSELFKEYPSLFIHVVQVSSRGESVDHDMLLNVLTNYKKFKNKEITADQGRDNISDHISHRLVKK